MGNVSREWKLEATLGLEFGEWGGVGWLGTGKLTIICNYIGIIIRALSPPTVGTSLLLSHLSHEKREYLWRNGRKLLNLKWKQCSCRGLSGL